MAGKKNEYVQLGGILCAITLVVALVLGGVNAITVGPIEKNAQAKTEEALAALIPDCEATALDVAEGTTANGYNATAVVYNCYEMKDSSGEVAGYCVEVAPTGFGGEIDMMVGIRSDGKVSGISILKMAETAGLGAKATEPEFSDQFKDAAGDGSLKVSKDGGAIEALTGATITSRAVTNGVDAAVDYVSTLS